MFGCLKSHFCSIIIIFLRLFLFCLLLLAINTKMVGPGEYEYEIFNAQTGYYVYDEILNQLCAFLLHFFSGFYYEFHTLSTFFRWRILFIWYTQARRLGMFKSLFFSLCLLCVFDFGFWEVFCPQNSLYSFNIKNM